MSSSEVPVAKILATNHLETHRFDYEISFNRFTARVDLTDSEPFAPPGRTEPRFTLRLEPNYNSNTTVRVLIFLESSKKKVYLKTTSWFVKKDGGTSQKAEYNFSLNNPGNNYCLISRSKSEFTNDSNGLLTNDTLTFYCEFTLDLEYFTEQLTTATKVIQQFDHHQPLADDLQKLLNSGQLADFSFKIDERIFQVHKAILSSRSPVFEAMFRHEAFEENTESSVPITDVDADVFEQLLVYLYTGRLPDLEKYGIGLLMAADKYQLESLKTAAEKALVSQLNAESMFNLLMIADLYNATKLKTEAMEYISSRASSQDILKALFTNKLFGSAQSKSLMDAIREMVK